VRISEESQGSKFPVTHWSAVLAARSPEPAQRERALEALLAAYWKPVYKYVRLRWNRAPEDAQDLTQGFFAGLLERDLLRRYDPAKSRLRTYLRLCVDSFVSNQDKTAQRQKRGGDAIHVALDFSAADEELSRSAMDHALLESPESMEQFFEKEWIRALFSEAVDELQKLCERNGKSLHFRLFEQYDLEDGSEPRPTYEYLARENNVAVTDVTNYLAWVRREFRRIVLERLREASGDEHEFQREARNLLGREPG